jgi:spermidine synthase
MELWYFEDHRPGVRLGLRCLRSLHSEKSAYQQIDVLETEEYGRMLLLDGLVMLTSRDEFIYHEMIAHPAAFVHDRARDVLVIGGGDGGTVRELLRHENISKIILCEIDKGVVDVSLRFFPEVSSGLKDSDRVEILYEDGARFVGDNPSGFDMIIVDSTDPVGPGKILFSRQFYRSCFNCLRPEGILIAQTESPFYHVDLIRQVAEGLKASGFGPVRFYTAPVPTYPGGYWSWAFAVKEGKEGLLHPIDSPALSGAGQDPGKRRVLKELRYYTQEIHRASFSLPRFLLDAIGG